MSETIKVNWRVFFTAKEDTHVIFCSTCGTPLMKCRGLPFRNSVLRLVAEGVVGDHANAFTTSHEIDLVDLSNGHEQQLKTSDYAAQQRRGSRLYF